MSASTMSTQQHVWLQAYIAAVRAGKTAPEAEWIASAAVSSFVSQFGRSA